MKIKIQNIKIFGLWASYYRVVRKVTVLLSNSLAWPALAGCDWAELFSEPGTNFILNSVIFCYINGYLMMFQNCSRNCFEICENNSLI